MKPVGVQFRQPSKVQYFDAGKLDIRQGDKVVVQTDKGLTLGRVTVTEPRFSQKNPKHLPAVVRLARSNDLQQVQRNASKEINAFAICKKRVRELKLPMKLIKAEFTLGGGKVTFYFFSEERIDFRDLVQGLSRDLGVKIEMVQVGVRNVAGIVGGVGVCGRALCCSTFLTDFRPISIKMAKVQNLSLNPEKVSGCCGRLLCCLQYEYDLYHEMSRTLPKIGKRVETPRGEGRVRSMDVLKQLVFVDISDERSIACFRADEISPKKPNPPPPKQQS